MKIRKALAGDLDAVVRLTEAAYAPYTALLGAPPIPVTEDYAPRIERGEVWLLENGKEVAGLLVLERHPDHAMIFSVAVAPAFQGKGFGIALLNFADEQARLWHLPEVRLYTNARMERNIALYTAYGFRETGRRPNPYRPGWMVVDMAKPVETVSRLDRFLGRTTMSSHGTIRAGMGGWTFEPWDTSFYPDKLPKAKQLNYASRQVPSIEVNGTYYSSFKEPTFVKWANEAPDGFVYSLKGNRFVTNRRVLGEAGESMMRFLGSGVAALGDKLGPILWQFAPTKKFDPDDFEAFLKLLPEKQDGVALRHAIEVRNDSFVVPEFAALARKYKVAIVYADHAKYPGIADVTGDFIYARLQTGSDDNPDCYTPKGLDEWAARAKVWAKGQAPADLPRADAATDAPVKPRDVFVYFITEGKVRAPFGAMALMKRVTG